MTMQNRGLKGFLSKPQLTNAMTTENSCQVKFANNLNKRTGLRIRLHDNKITTEVKLDGVSYDHC